MPIAVTCQCGKSLQGTPELSEGRVHCPICGRVLPPNEHQQGESAGKLLDWQYEVLTKMQTSAHINRSCAIVSPKIIAVTDSSKQPLDLRRVAQWLMIVAPLLLSLLAIVAYVSVSTGRQSPGFVEARVDLPSHDSAGAEQATFQPNGKIPDSSASHADRQADTNSQGLTPPQPSVGQLSRQSDQYAEAENITASGGVTGDVSLLDHQAEIDTEPTSSTLAAQGTESVGEVPAYVTRAILGQGEQSDTVTVYAGSSIAVSIKEGANGVSAEPKLDVPGSVWLIAEGGLTWNGVKLKEGGIYVVDDNSQPRPTDEEYSVWVLLNQEKSIYRGRSSRTTALSTVHAGEPVQLLIHGKKTEGWHKVRTVREPRAEGWFQGVAWGATVFLRFPTDSEPDLQAIVAALALVSAQRDGSGDASNSHNAATESHSADTNNSRGASAQQQDNSATATSAAGLPNNWPRYSRAINPGRNGVRVDNTTKSAVRVGMRSGDRGKDFVVPANSVRAVQLPSGHYDIYVHYRNDPGALYQGDSFFVEENSNHTITLSAGPNGNYRGRRIN